MIHLRFSQILSGPGLGISPIGLSLIWPIHGVGLSRASETNHSTADSTNGPWIFFKLIARHCRGCCQEHPSPRAPQRRRRVRCVGGGKADSPARMDGDARPREARAVGEARLAEACSCPVRAEGHFEASSQRVSSWGPMWLGECLCWSSVGLWGIFIPDTRLAWVRLVTRASVWCAPRGLAVHGSPTIGWLHAHVALGLQPCSG